MVLDPSVPSEHSRRRNNLPSNTNAPPTHSTDHNSFQRLRSPLTRTHSITPDRVAAPQTPMNTGAGALAAPGKVFEGAQHPGQGTKPRHAPNFPQEVKPTTSGPPPPGPRLAQDAPDQSKALLTETPSLGSSSSLEHDPPIGFFTARAAESLQHGSGLPLKVPAFNPHSESPSIRKTAGVDHTKTKPVGREAVRAPPQPAVPRANSVNPQTDKTRRVGMPVGAASPLQNRSSYKPPQMKRPVENSGPRSALSDVTNMVPDGGGDSKRQKIELEARAVNSNEGILNS